MCGLLRSFGLLRVLRVHRVDNHTTNQVAKGGQGAALGVAVGWRLVKVGRDGVGCAAELLDATSARRARSDPEATLSFFTAGAAQPPSQARANGGVDVDGGWSGNGARAVLGAGPFGKGYGFARDGGAPPAASSRSVVFDVVSKTKMLAGNFHL